MFNIITKVLLILSFNTSLVILQDNSVDTICKSCGDIVNEYCCKYYRNCCDYLNPTGCPTPSSPEARISCRKPVSCRSSTDCPLSKQCCDTAICGATCVKPTFPGYKY
ncbi:unnamed protein product [Tenebrio molitor]|nr:unnamed protein product [Tenebrio molitor]